MQKPDMPSKIRTLYHQLVHAPRIHFPPLRTSLNITCNHGVYIIYAPDKKVVHVGRTLRGKEGLCQRLQDHINGTSSFSKNYLKEKRLNIRDGFSFCYLEVESAKKRTYLENLATGKLCPLYIGTGELKPT